MTEILVLQQFLYGISYSNVIHFRPGLISLFSLNAPRNEFTERKWTGTTGNFVLNLSNNAEILPATIWPANSILGDFSEIYPPRRARNFSKRCSKEMK